MPIETRGVKRYIKGGKVTSLAALVFYLDAATSERQIVIALGLLLPHRRHRRDVICADGRCLHWLLLCGIGHALDLPCTDVIIPTPIVLACIDVKRHIEFFAKLYIELVNLVTPQIETHLAGILVMVFDYIFLLLPLIAIGLAYAFLQWHDRYDFTSEIHVLFIYYV